MRRRTLELLQEDFKTAFLTVKLVETVFMDQPNRLRSYEARGEGGKKMLFLITCCWVVHLSSGMSAGCYSKLVV